MLSLNSFRWIPSQAPPGAPGVCLDELSDPSEKITLLPLKKKKWSSPLLNIILFCLGVGRFVLPLIRRQSFLLHILFGELVADGKGRDVTGRDVIYKK